MKKDVKFTLLELLLSIICIIIISLVIIPFVSNIFNVTEKKVFIEFADSVYQRTSEKSNTINKEIDTCYIYDINKDLDFDYLGSFEGYSVVKDKDIYLFIHNQEYMLINHKYISKINSDKSIKEFNENEYKLISFLSSINCQNSEYITK